MSEFAESQDQLEQRLRSMRPQPVETLESEVLYRCGWEAALASQKGVSRPTVPYSLGVLSGIAATLFFAFAVRPVWTDKTNRPAMAESGTLESVADEDSAVVKSEEFQEDFPSTEQQFAASKVDLRALESPAETIWRPEYMISVERPVRSENQEFELLSLAAQNRWGHALTKVPNSAATSNEPASTRQQQTLAEMLFEAGRKGLF